MSTRRLKITSGVSLPGGVDALPGQVHDVPTRFAQSLLWDGRAVLHVEDATPAGEPKQRDPHPVTRDPKPRRR